MSDIIFVHFWYIMYMFAAKRNYASNMFTEDQKFFMYTDTTRSTHPLPSIGW